MKSYSVIAKYYDTFSQNDCDYESWSQYLCEIAKSHSVKNVAELACGTGKMTSLLTKQGFSVTAVDQSAEMLAVASQKCRAKFICQDMKKLALTHPADMVVVVNDGVNYLAPEKLEQFFCTVSQNLLPDAPFVFDVSSAYKLQNVVGNNVFYVDGDQATLLWTNSLSGNKVTMSLTLFERQGETYTRQDEKHTQYVHTQQQVEQALLSAGFTVKQVTADYGKKVFPDSLRLTFYAINKG